MAKDDVRKEGAKTIYRPEKDDVSGGSDKSVQTEATGAEGSANLYNSGSTSGGAAGRINELDHNPTPRRDGGESSDDQQQPAGNRGELTR